MKRDLTCSAASAPMIHASSPKHSLNFKELRGMLASASPIRPAIVGQAALLNRAVRPLMALTAPLPVVHPDLPFTHLLPVQQNTIRYLRWHEDWLHVKLQVIVERVLMGDPLLSSHRAAPDFVIGIDVSTGDDPPKGARSPRPSEVLALVDVEQRRQVLVANPSLDLTRPPWRAIAFDSLQGVTVATSPQELVLLSRLEHPPAPPKMPPKRKAGHKYFRIPPRQVSSLNLFADELAAASPAGPASPEVPPDDPGPSEAAASVDSPDDPSQAPSQSGVTVVVEDSEDE